MCIKKIKFNEYYIKSNYFVLYFYINEKLNKLDEINGCIFDSKNWKKNNDIIFGKRCKVFNAINKEKIMYIITELKDSNFTIKNIYN